MNGQQPQPKYRSSFVRSHSANYDLKSHNKKQLQSVQSHLSKSSGSSVHQRPITEPTQTTLRNNIVLKSCQLGKVEKANSWSSSSQSVIQSKRPIAQSRGCESKHIPNTCVNLLNSRNEKQLISQLSSNSSLEDKRVRRPLFSSVSSRSGSPSVQPKPKRQYTKQLKSEAHSKTNPETKNVKGTTKGAISKSRSSSLLLDKSRPLRANCKGPPSKASHPGTANQKKTYIQPANEVMTAPSRVRKIKNDGEHRETKQLRSRIGGVPPLKRSHPETSSSMSLLQEQKENTFPNANQVNNCGIKGDFCISNHCSGGPSAKSNTIHPSQSVSTSSVLHHKPRLFQSTKGVPRPRPRPRRLDCHRHLGEWMTVVDAAVAETIALNKEQPTSVLLTARQSLGTLGLLAADAVRTWVDDCKSIPSDITSGTTETFTAQQSPVSQNKKIYNTHSSTDYLFTPRPQQPRHIDLNAKNESTKGSNKNTWRRPSEETPSSIVGSAFKIPAAFNECNIHNGSIKRRESNCRSYRPSPSCSFSSARRPFHRRAGQATAALLRGIRLRNPTTISEAIEQLDADPNEYLSVPTAHLPWILLAPYQRLTSISTNYGSSQGIPSQIRLHPLHLAVATSSYSVVRTMIEGGACVNALDQWHRNPLHVLIQPPPICIREQHSDRIIRAKWPNKLTDPPSYKSEDDVHKDLSNFLYKQAGKRTSNEAQIASVLCVSGLDLSRSDIWGHSCIDYATAWLRISRLITSQKIGIHWLLPSVPEGPLWQYLNHDCPLPIIGPPDISKYNSIQLSARIPHEIIDIVLLHEDHLRLCAMAPIVGLDVGGEINPQYLLNVPSNRPSTEQPPKLLSACTPTRPDQSTVMQSGLTLNHNNPLSGRQTTSFSSSITRSQRTAGTVQTRRPSHLERRAQQFFQTPSRKNFGSITLLSPSPGITRLAVRLTPQAQKLGTVSRMETPTQIFLAQSCLRALQTNSSRYNTIANEIPPNIAETPIQARDDFAVFLTLASSPTFRYHSALLGVWEFLGAEVLPNGKKSLQEKEGYLGDKPNDFETEEIQTHQIFSLAQPTIRMGRLSEI